MTLSNGKYRTAHGSRVEISGRYSGIYSIEFDWFEEDGTCCECDPSIYEDRLVWSCSYHDGGSAPLVRAGER